MSFIDTYSERLVDLAIFHPQHSLQGVIAKMEMSLFPENTSGFLIGGVQKLVQRVLMALLNEQESQRIFPEAGCTFMTRARQGFWRSSIDVQQDFSSAMVDVKQQVNRGINEKTSADEILAEATLERVLFLEDEIRLDIKIVSEAGTQVNVLAPLSVSLIRSR